MTVSDKDKDEIVKIAHRLNEVGYKILATKGTADKLKSNDIPVEVVGKIAARMTYSLEYKMVKFKLLLIQ